MTPEQKASFRNHGFCIVRNAVSGAALEQLHTDFVAAQHRLSHPTFRGALQHIPSLQDHLPKLQMSPVREETPKLVRAICFDKTTDANWTLRWHQDTTIAVAERHHVAGFKSWSIKDGQSHAHAPASILSHMYAVRLNLDDADEGNGALEVIPGTHRSGVLTRDQISAAAKDGLSHLCAGSAGDIVVMHPLALHRSKRSMSGEHRRVIHLEFATCDLPAPLKWADPYAAGKIA